MQLHVLVVLLAGIALVQAGYHKVRPPPPNLPLPKLHYGPKPPSHYYSKSPPFIPRRPQGPPRNPIRPPTRPFYSKPTPPTPPPFPSWKTHNSFRPPVVKESFYSAPLTPDFSLHFTKDDDKGPIHTIPAPNLSPADKPHDFPESPSSGLALEAVLKHGQAVHSHSATSYQVTEDPSAYKPYSGSPSYFAPDPDPSLPTIEVTKSQDPFSIPSNGVRPLDVYQQELADQAQSYQQNTQLSYADGAANSLSSQELFTLLNGYSQHGQQLVGVQQVHQQPMMTPEMYQQYLLAATGGHQAPATSYQQQQHGVLYHQQHYQQQLQRQQQPQEAQISQNFHPQFENFNYNEQTQESAYGSDSFPSASSISVGVKRAVPKDFNYGNHNSIPSDYKGRKNEYLGKNEEDVKDEEVLSNQVDYEDEKSTEISVKEKLPLNILNAGHYTTLPNKQTAETLATLAAAGNVNNQIVKSPYQNEQQNEVKLNNENQKQINETSSQNYERPNPDSRPAGPKGNQEESSPDNEYNDEEILDPSDKDQMSTSPMQNSMAMYQTTFYRNTREKESPAEEHNYEDTESDYTQEEEKEIRSNLGSRSSTTERVSNYNAHHNLPYGAKLRPKRV